MVRFQKKCENRVIIRPPPPTKPTRLVSLAPLPVGLNLSLSLSVSLLPLSLSRATLCILLYVYFYLVSQPYRNSEERAGRAGEALRSGGARRDPAPRARNRRRQGWGRRTSGAGVGEGGGGAYRFVRGGREFGVNGIITGPDRCTAAHDPAAAQQTVRICLAMCFLRAQDEPRGAKVNVFFFMFSVLHEI